MTACKLVPEIGFEPTTRALRITNTIMRLRHDLKGKCAVGMFLISGLSGILYARFGRFNGRIRNR
jgi:hypothetical protein